MPTPTDQFLASVRDAARLSKASWKRPELQSILESAYLIGPDKVNESELTAEDGSLVFPPESNQSMALVLPPPENSKTWIPLLTFKWFPAEDGTGHGSVSIWLVNLKAPKPSNHHLARILRFEKNEDGVHTYPHHTVGGTGVPYGPWFYLLDKGCDADFVRVPLIGECAHPQAMLAQAFLTIYGPESEHLGCFASLQADDTQAVLASCN